MKKSLALSLFTLLGVLTVFSGCAQKKTQKDISVLQAQVGTLTDEVVRLDQSLQETRASLPAGRGSVSSANPNSISEEGTVAKGIYRTPSGFEIPSANIQKALKKAGYFQGEVDGKIGPQTRSAIKSFQKDNGLHSDGVVGRQTWVKMKAYLAS